MSPLIQTLRSKQEFYSVKELLEDVVEQTGYRLELQAEGTEEAKERLENIDELISKAAAYDESAEEPSLQDFLEEVALVADIDSLEEDGEHVVMMTLHSAKGLEFPVVFLTGMEDGMFPSYLSIVSDDPTDLEEERRLCYVGITRAMKELYLTAARQRMVRGEIHYNRLSRFVEDIPKEVLASQEETRRERPSLAEKSQESKPSPRQQAREAFQSKAFQPKQFAVKKSQGLSYEVGDTVRHIKFGQGVVTAITEGGRDYEVTVNFEKPA